MSEYTAVPSTGKLKLKGVKDSRVEKKKKKHSKSTNPSGKDDQDNTVVLQQLEDEDEKSPKQKNGEGRHLIQENPSRAMDLEDEAQDGEDIRDHLKTEAERRHEEQRRKRLEKRFEKEGVKTHKQRVEELNKYLSNLSEHHDMPKIGPG